MDLNSHWIRKSLEYHGLPLKSAWEGERGEQDLARIGIAQVDYSTYRKRTQNFGGQAERRFRIKLHDFIAKNANSLFDSNLVDPVSSTEDVPLPGTGVKYPALDKAPPLEYFSGFGKDAEHVYKRISPGDFVYTKRSDKGHFNACSEGRVNTYLLKLGTYGNLTFAQTQVSGTRSKVLTVDPSYDYLSLGSTEPVTEFPAFFELLEEHKYRSYQDYFDQSLDFKGARDLNWLYGQLDLDEAEHYTNMANARGRYPPQEYADDIRQKQASKLAFRSVAEGIEHFKEGRHSEAFQCLNKALSIDSRNVEGLVARGALYANSGSFKKAVEDFENALKLNPSHANARKYMGETLVALGRSYEDENNLEAAKKAYQDCLMIIPHHEEAQTSLDFLKSKMKATLLIEPAELQLPDLNFGDDSLRLGKKDGGDSGKRTKDKSGKSKKRNKEKKSKKKYSSSSSSSEDSDDNEDKSSSSSSSDSSSNSSDSSDSEAAAKKKKKRAKKGPSSPPPMGQSGAAAPPPPAISNDYELQVRNFLSEMNRDEDNYEEKVRRFVEETSKYRKEREKAAGASAEKKKKKKESKKSKKEAKKKRKEKGSSGKKDKKGKGDAALNDEEKLREALKIFENFPILDELGSKLQSLYGKDKKGNDAPAQPPSPPPKEPEPQQGKWKMMFAKDPRAPEPSTSKGATSSSNTTVMSASTHTSKQQSALAKAGFGKDDSDDERRRSRGKKSPSPVLVPIPPRPKYARLLSPASMNRPAPIRSGPVVLDKFGNFRLAEAEPEQLKQIARGRRSRSRRRSRSSSRSRSPMGRRRSSRSRSRSRSSRSYSRSRSRSRSADRWRSGGRFRGGRGGSGGNGQGFFKNRFNNGPPRGGAGGRGRGGRDWEYRGARGGGGSGGGGHRDSGFRPRGGRVSSGGRFNDRRFDRLSRSRSFSPGPRQGRSPDGGGRPRSPMRGKSPGSPAVNQHRGRRDRERDRDRRSVSRDGRRDRDRERAKGTPSPRKKESSRRTPSRSPDRNKEQSGRDKDREREKDRERDRERDQKAQPPPEPPVQAPSNDDDEPPPPGCE